MSRPKSASRRIAKLDCLSFDASYGHDANTLSTNALSTNALLTKLETNDLSNSQIDLDAKGMASPFSDPMLMQDLSLDELAMAGIHNSIEPSKASIKRLDERQLPEQIDKIVLTVGNSMMGDDGAGPRLADKLIEQPLDGWQVLDGGGLPEDSLHILRRLKPKMLVLVDAADMGEAPGCVRVIDPQTIASMFIMSTHSLPLNFLIDELKSFIDRVEFIGIQPRDVAFSAPMTSQVCQGVEDIYHGLAMLEIGSPMPKHWLN